MSSSFFGGRLEVNFIFIPVAAVMCYLNGLPAVLAFSLALLLHESGHAVMAQAMGVRVKYMELMPFGCTAHIESFAVLSPGAEIAMAAAGPLANLALAALLQFGSDLFADSFLAALYRSNLSLAAVNLLPALPMDGGRVLCCALSYAMPRLACVRLVSAMGVFTGLCITALGICFWATGSLNPTILLMGGFMIFASARHYRFAPLSVMEGTLSKRREILRRGSAQVRSTAIPAERSVGEAIARMDARSYNLLYVLDDQMHLIRTVGEGELLDYALCRGSGAKLGDVARGHQVFDPRGR